VPVTYATRTWKSYYTCCITSAELEVMVALLGFVGSWHCRMITQGAMAFNAQLPPCPDFDSLPQMFVTLN
jgi:hypothetical protein